MSSRVIPKRYFSSTSGFCISDNLFIYNALLLYIEKQLRFSATSSIQGQSSLVYPSTEVGQL